MDKQDWYQCGAKIGDLVQSAIDSQNFSQLSKAIQDTLNQTLESAAKTVRDAGYYKGYEQHKTPYEYRMRGGNAYNTAQQRSAADPFGLFHSLSSYKRDKGVKGIASMAIGYALAAITGMGFISLGILSAVTGFVGFRFLSIFLLVLTVAFLLVGRSGRKAGDKAARAKQYLQIINNRSVVQLDELAAASGRTVDYVRKDLKDMIQDGMFGGNIMMDDAQTCVMAGPETYAQYRSTMRSYEERKQEEAKSQERRRAAEKDMASYSEETREILKEGEEFIAHIHAVNEAVDDEEFTQKLSKMEQTVTRIFQQVAKDPESAPDLHRLMTYYLPITRKLVDAYRDLYAQGARGKNVLRTKKEIVESLDTVNGAFEVLLDSFFEDTAWDISTDISTLKTMMARDGLTGSDFQTGSKPAATPKTESSQNVTSEQTDGSVSSGKESKGSGSGIHLTFGSGAAAAAPDQEEQ
ncbi:MAG: 5-bromo-4-chloroindolyl phosphate hydrolysis family protein [Lachnospiraceae bacterium]|nr:5-bromo-4-chloroindolyl phosphate hydrolysis family protein [Lachnospiraceae bacterium]